MVVFGSTASRILRDDNNGEEDVFVHDRLTGETVFAAPIAEGRTSRRRTLEGTLSQDGRYAVFLSLGRVFVGEYLGGIYLTDLHTGVTELVSVRDDGTPSQNGQHQLNTVMTAMSADNRYVVFMSTANDLVPGFTPAITGYNIYVRDRVAGRTELVSLDSAGAPASLGGQSPNISPDGRFVAWETRARLVPGDTSDAQGNILAAVTCVSSAADCWGVGYYFNSTGTQTLVLRRTASPPPIPTRVVSRKTHGAARDFDIDLPLVGNPGLECRTGGASGDFQMIVTFPSVVTFANATITSGTGAVASSGGSGTSTVTANLTGIANAQTITLTLSGVSDGTNTGDVGVRMSVLLGDTTASGDVNSSDIGETKANSGQVTNAGNFRTDVTANGVINSSDIGTIKTQSGASLP